MQDANYNVLGVATVAGVVIERYEYTPYGQRTVYSHGWSPADFDNDGDVDSDDTALYVAALNGGPHDPDSIYDLSGDGEVDGDDTGPCTAYSDTALNAMAADPLITYAHLESRRTTAAVTCVDGVGLCEIGRDEICGCRHVGHLLSSRRLRDMERAGGSTVSEQLAYALITPYSLFKSRTGGIIGRLLAHARLKLVAARMYVFSDPFVDAYGEIICGPSAKPAFAEAWRRYLDESLRPQNPWGFLPRCMLLLLRGPNAVRHLRDDIIGDFTEQPVGDTIRGTYGDLIRDETGNIRYFEPAVITCGDPALHNRHLRLLADYAISNGGVLTGRIQYDQDQPEISLVLLKPDNFERRSRRPGNIIDTFSLTGLRIVGAKLFRMTVAQGEEFYGPLKEVFVEKLKGNVTQEVYHRLHDAFAFPFTMADAEALSERLAQRNATAEFNRIVEYMTGVNPDDVPGPAEKAVTGSTRCLALLYEGPGAIEKIRTVLGSTDPTQAEPGTVRSDFGRDLMRNGAHASDSPADALRERKIVGLDKTETQTCDVSEIINEYLASQQ